jgi:hypothetical protein
MPGTLSTDTLATFNPTIWRKDTILARQNKLVLAMSVDRYDKDVLTMGKALQVPRHALQVARTKAAGLAITYDANSEGSLTININTQAYHAFIVDDIEEAQANQDIMQIYTDGAGYAIAKKVDDDLFAAAAAGVTQTTGTASTTVRIATTFITTANQYLDIANAPDEDRFLTVDAYGYKQMMDLDSFVRYDAAGQSAILNGRVGTAYGFEILKTMNQTAAANISTSYAFHKSFLALAMQREETIKNEYSVDYIGTKVVAFNIYGAAIARSDHGVKVTYGIG